ncbi:hypothetical protein D3C76_1629600 [compost metagenome]
MGGEGLNAEPGSGQGYQAPGKATDGPLEAASSLRSLHKGTPQPLGLSRAAPQFALQSVLFLGKVAGIDPSLG